MPRKRIAVLMAGLNRGGYLSDYSAGLAKEAAARDVDLFIFNAQGYVDETTAKNERIESMIFELPELDSFDGIVALPSTFAGEETTQRVLELLKAHGDIPQLLVDYESTEVTTLHFDDDTAVRSLMRHPVHQHSLRRFAIIGGPVGNPVADHRLSVALTALRYEGGTVEDRDILCGSWMRGGGVECCERLIAEGRLPEAIVCMNDDMALGAMDALEKAGVRVPEDVAVTGFDSRVEALGCRVTTIRRPVESAGVTTIRCLMDRIDGIEREPARIVLPTRVVYGTTCGCASAIDVSGRYLNSLARELYRVDRTMMRANSFSRAVFAVQDKREAGNVFNGFAESWEIDELYVCVTPEFPETVRFSGRERYPERMLLLAGRNRQGRCEQQLISTRELVPGGSDVPRALVVNPLYYSDHVFGYAVMDLEFSASLTLYSVLMLLDSALMSLSQQTVIRAYARSVERMSHFDTLTGLLNRRGYARRAEALVAEATEKGAYYAALSADLDGMKYINDHFGHAAGDAAICRMAKAMRCLEQESMECVHISGDEFLAIGIVDSPDAAVRIHALLCESMKRLDEEDPWIVPLCASIGVHVEIPEPGSTIDHFTKLADRAMYEEKRRHHLNAAHDRL